MNNDTSRREEIRIRKRTVEDISFIQSLMERFVQVGTVSWRDPAQMQVFHEHGIKDAVNDTQPDSIVLVAEDGQGNRPGFIHILHSEDFFTQEPQGYIAALAVSEEAAGKGIGRLLMECGEAWARERGYRILALDTFAMNTHARSFYQKLGYVEETVKMIKVL